MVRVNGMEFSTESIELSMDSVFTITTKDNISVDEVPIVDVEIIDGDVTHTINTADYDVTFEKDGDLTIVTMAYVDKMTRINNQMSALQAEIEAIKAVVFPQVIEGSGASMIEEEEE